MRELRSAVANRVPLVALLEADATRGGLDEQTIRAQLLHGTRPADERIHWPWVGHPQPRTVEERMRVQEIIVATMQCLEHALLRLDDQITEVRSDADVLH